MKKFFSLKIIFFSILLLFFFGRDASAAVLDFDLGKNQAETGEIFNVTLFLNTEEELFNAIEGDLRYNELLLKAESVNISGSFISFWVEKPEIKTPGIIHFSGIIPGGISTARSEVFKVIFRAKGAGDASLSLSNANLFLNNGEGTRANVEYQDANIKIIESMNNSLLPIVIQDTVLPEKFTVTRSKDLSIYDDKWFAVFSAKDKDSGVDYYEVCEFFSCAKSDSPHLLKYQNPFYYIVVRAYDLNGNARNSFLISPYLILLSFIAIVALIYAYRRYLRSYKV